MTTTSSVTAARGDVTSSGVVTVVATAVATDIGSGKAGAVPGQASSAAAAAAIRWAAVACTPDRSAVEATGTSARPRRDWLDGRDHGAMGRGGRQCTWRCMVRGRAGQTLRFSGPVAALGPSTKTSRPL